MSSKCERGFVIYRTKVPAAESMKEVLEKRTGMVHNIVPHADGLELVNTYNEVNNT